MLIDLQLLESDSNIRKLILDSIKKGGLKYFLCPFCKINVDH